MKQETITWRELPADGMPDAEITVQLEVTHDRGEVETWPGWWSGTHWIDATTGDQIERTGTARVTAWADVPVGTAAAQQGEAVTWGAAEAISAVPEVDEAIAALLADNTADNATGLVQAVLQHAAPPARQTAALTEAAADVLAERRRQIEAEGWTPENDDGHTFGELVQAAADLCVYGTDFRVVDLDGDRMLGWGLTEKHSHDRRRQLVIAAALILAEIERLDRAHGITPAGGEG